MFNLHPDKPDAQNNLEARVSTLEDLVRRTPDALDILTSLGELHGTVHRDHDPLAVLQAVRALIKRLLPFEIIAFQTVAQGQSELALADCDPPHARGYVQAELDYQAQGRTQPLTQTRALLLPTRDRKRTLVLHALATKSRVWGMFLGVLPGRLAELPDAILDLLAVIMLNGANALEGDALYRRLNEQNTFLEHTVEERKRELEQTRQSAEAANRAKSECLANMAHEIRTPMTGVVGVLELLAESNLDAEQRQFVDTASNSADALLTTINNVLDFSKVAARKLELEAAPFELGDLVEEVTVLFAEGALRKGVQLACRVPPDGPLWVRGDPTRLRQILTNLVSNAIKFTDEGQVMLRLDTNSANGAGLEARFAVQDTGIGIASEVQRSHGEAIDQAVQEQASK